MLKKIHNTHQKLNFFTLNGKWGSLMGFWRKEQITFFLTTKCNLSCIYCYMPKMVVAQEHKEINIDFARRAIIDFFSASNSRTIRFFGSGEPTLAFSQMKKIWEIAYSLAGDDLKVELETNGYFHDEIAEWIKDHVNYLWISCDGDTLIHDSHRPRLDGSPSSGLVYNNINRFSCIDNIQFGVRATVSPLNIDKQCELIDFFHRNNVKYVCASPIYQSIVNSKVNAPSLLNFSKHFVPAFYRALDLNMFYQSLMTVNFDEEVEAYCQAHIPTPRITTDGYVSCCDWASLGPIYLPNTIQQKMIYGKYDQEKDIIVYDKEKINQIRKRNCKHMMETFCHDCRALRHCVGGCVGKMAAATGDFFHASKDWCDAVLYLFDRLPLKQHIPVLHP